MTQNTVQRALDFLKRRLTQNDQPEFHFHGHNYLRHNARRLEHLASLGIPVSGMSVLEVGAGIGDHSHYYLDRQCQVTITEARKENLDYLTSRYPRADILQLDLDYPHTLKNSPFDIIHCYGLLYHLKNPGVALDYLGQSCRGILFLETCVSFGDEEEINLTEERQTNPTQAISGTGCRPTRRWLFTRLKKSFDHVYIPKTQPNHEEFPIDWQHPEKHQGLSRSIFIASKTPLDNANLTSELIPQQTRHS
jgi:hypothetical protein